MMLRNIGFLALMIGAAALIWNGADRARAGESGPDAASVALDRMAIEDTLRRYVRGLDDPDLDGYLATLTDDAKFVSEEGNYEGKEAIRDYVAPVLNRRLEQRAQGAGTSTHHVVTNQSIEFIDADNAVVRAYWMFVVAPGPNEPAAINIMGSSEDYLTRRDEKWLIRERRVAP